MSLTLRDGTPSDLPALSEIEARAFPGDRLSRRSLSRFLKRTSPSALRVAESDGAVAGYALVLVRARSSIARLYSIAVADAARGRGIGAALLDDIERLAHGRGATALRLEVRADNGPAIRLYESRGYVRFAVYPRYYEDGMDALRFERRLGAGDSSGAAPGDGEEDRSPATTGGFDPVMAATSSGSSRSGVAVSGA